MKNLAVTLLAILIMAGFFVSLGGLVVIQVLAILGRIPSLSLWITQSGGAVIMLVVFAFLVSWLAKRWE